MKVGLFFKNGNLTSINASKPELGNPGFGGRQYMNLGIAYYLHQLQDPEITPVLFAQGQSKLPQGLQVSYADSLVEALKQAPSLNVSTFIIDVTLSSSNIDLMLAEAENQDIKLIVRLGLLPSTGILKKLYACSRVMAVISVEQYSFDWFSDHIISRKLCVIPNAIPAGIYGEPLPFSQREKQVVYLGSLVPQKGFGELARAWPEVLKKVPDARLVVIGSGDLYRHDTELGKWGVATEEFESRNIRPFLSSADGQPHHSVEFLGNLGYEKIDYLKRSMVGIANPVGGTETFCISAVEIQAAGTPVIAGARGGLLYTVKDGDTGFLVRNHKSLASYITHLLAHPETAEKMGKNAYDYVSKRYDFPKVAQAWRNLLVDIANREEPLKVSVYDSLPASKQTLPSRCNAVMKNWFGYPDFWPACADLYDKLWIPAAKYYKRLKKVFRKVVSGVRGQSKGQTPGA